MRLFVGLPLASEVLQELSEAVSRLRSAQDGLRWTALESWHITLQFLGNTDQQHCDCVQARLAEIQAAPFEVRIGELGCFERVGVFFADVIPTCDLVELAKTVAAATAKCGFVAETRPYHPHITLARAKGEGRGGSLRVLQDRMKRDQRKQGAKFTGFRAAEFLLYESHTRQEGAEYEVKGRFPLGLAE
jgi:RNA 2',3'-cyclic 3'-phosphodiesterase